ncbi:MAG: hypothetical protein JO306_03710 [Gemmatimonadetes bacterium]|nr:hypothetical protein [Gemmatimonadota bacterium]
MDGTKLDAIAITRALLAYAVADGVPVMLPPSLARELVERAEAGHEAWRPAAGQDWTVKQVAKEFGRGGQWVRDYAHEGRFGGHIGHPGAPYREGGGERGRLRFPQSAVDAFKAWQRAGCPRTDAANGYPTVPPLSPAAAGRRPRAPAGGRLERRMAEQVKPRARPLGA